MSYFEQVAIRIKRRCQENPDWYDDDILLTEDPAEIARYRGLSGHALEEQLLHDMEEEDEQ